MDRQNLTLSTMIQVFQVLPKKYPKHVVDMDNAAKIDKNHKHLILPQRKIYLKYNIRNIYDVK